LQEAGPARAFPRLKEVGRILRAHSKKS
jgi:hypothetical protein